MNWISLGFGIIALVSLLMVALINQEIGEICQKYCEDVYQSNAFYRLGGGCYCESSGIPKDLLSNFTFNFTNLE